MATLEEKRPNRKFSRTCSVEVPQAAMRFDMGDPVGVAAGDGKRSRNGIGSGPLHQGPRWRRSVGTTAYSAVPRSKSGNGMEYHGMAMSYIAA